MLRPRSTAEVAAILQAGDAQDRIALVPQGGNTGLVGGQTPIGGEVMVSLMRRMDKVREIDIQINTMTVETGMVLQNAQARAAEEVDRLFPLSLGAEGSCTPSAATFPPTPAAPAALAYGVAREMALRLEVVLADGRILSSLSKLKKDNTGFTTCAIFSLVPRARSASSPQRR